MVQIRVDGRNVNWNLLYMIKQGTKNGRNWILWFACHPWSIQHGQAATDWNLKKFLKNYHIIFQKNHLLEEAIALLLMIYNLLMKEKICLIYKLSSFAIIGG